METHHVGMPVEETRSHKVAKRAEKKENGHKREQKEEMGEVRKMKDAK